MIIAINTTKYEYYMHLGQIAKIKHFQGLSIQGLKLKTSSMRILGKHTLARDPSLEGVQPWKVSILDSFQL